MAAVDELAAEAAVTPDERLSTLKVTLVDTELEVIPSTEWRSSAIHAIHIGDFDAWAATSLTDESWEIWQEIDPTTAEITAFFNEYQRLARESLGNSNASRRSSRSTARR